MDQEKSRAVTFADGVVREMKNEQARRCSEMCPECPSWKAGCEGYEHFEPGFRPDGPAYDCYDLD